MHMILYYVSYLSISMPPFSALTLLVGCWEGHPVRNFFCFKTLLEGSLANPGLAGK